MRRQLLVGTLCAFVFTGSELGFAQRINSVAGGSPFQLPNLVANCAANCANQVNICQTTCQAVRTSSSSTFLSIPLAASTCVQTCSFQRQTCQAVCPSGQ
jgi:hypothetical protein